MPFNEILAIKIRDMLKSKRNITEKKMFGGLCFLHKGNMLCGVDNKGELMIRVGADKYAALLKRKYTKEMNFTGKPLKGMLHIYTDGIKTKTTLSNWIGHGLKFTSTLPEKKKT